MGAISTKSMEDNPALEPLMQSIAGAMGFVPNSTLTMAHWPELLNAFSHLAMTVLQSGEVSGELSSLLPWWPAARRVVVTVRRTQPIGTQCRGEPREIAAAFEFESSPLFSDRERSALRFAWHAALQPCAVEDQDYSQLKKCFSERQIVEIVAVVSLFGFLNRGMTAWAPIWRIHREPLQKKRYLTSVGRSNQHKARANCYWQHEFFKPDY